MARLPGFGSVVLVEESEHWPEHHQAGDGRTIRTCWAPNGYMKAA